MKLIVDWKHHQFKNQKTSLKITFEKLVKNPSKYEIKSYIPWRQENHTIIDTQKARKHVYAHESKIMSKQDDVECKNHVISIIMKIRHWSSYEIPFIKNKKSSKLNMLQGICMFCQN